MAVYVCEDVRTRCSYDKKGSNLTLRRVTFPLPPSNNDSCSYVYVQLYELYAPNNPLEN